MGTFSTSSLRFCFEYQTPIWYIDNLFVGLLSFLTGELNHRSCVGKGRELRLDHQDDWFLPLRDSKV